MKDGNLYRYLAIMPNGNQEFQFHFR